MHIWNTNKVVDKFKAEAMSDGETFRYYIFTLLIYYMLIEANLWIPSEHPYSKLDLMLFISTVFFVIIGNLLAYRKNTDGKNFITRAICLSVPIGIKLIVAYCFVILPTIGVLYYYDVFPATGTSLQEKIFQLSSLIILEFMFYLRLVRGIERINEK